LNEFSRRKESRNRHHNTTVVGSHRGKRREAASRSRFLAFRGGCLKRARKSQGTRARSRVDTGGLCNRNAMTPPQNRRRKLANCCGLIQCTSDSWRALFLFRSVCCADSRLGVRNSLALSGGAYSSSEEEATLRTARKASCGMSTWPTRFMRRLPSFCFSRSLRLREMSPP